jgi:hypothetical protein
MNSISDITGGSISFSTYVKFAKIFVGMLVGVNLFHAIIMTMSFATNKDSLETVRIYSGQKKAKYHR